MLIALASWMNHCSCHPQPDWNTKLTDDTLVQAIAESRSTFDQFVAAFRQRERAQTDFVVVILRDVGDSYVPVGILVDGITGDTISGRVVENTLIAQPGRHIECTASDIVDWRYIDTFELEGGMLYRTLYERLPRMAQFKIRDIVPFLIRREKAEQVDEPTRRIFRDIANGRLKRIQGLPVENLERSGLSGRMPTLTFGTGRRVTIHPRTIPVYASRYGTPRIIDYLVERGAMEAKSGEFSPLAESSYAGNVETTKRMLELGFDAECKDEVSLSPLHRAVSSGHADIVHLLLKFGADPNACDNTGRTPLFYVKSCKIAEELIQAGADVSAVNDMGEPCIATHFIHGRGDIVRLLVQHGAEQDGPLRDSPVTDGTAAIVEYLEESGDTEVLRAIEISQATDFGYVLPVRAISRSALKGAFE